MSRRLVLLSSFVATCAVACSHAKAPVTEAAPVAAVSPGIDAFTADGGDIAKPRRGTPAVAHSAVESAPSGIDPAIDQMLLALGDSSTVLHGPKAFLSAGAAAPEPDITWDIDVNSYLTHDRIDYYVDRFTGDVRDRFVSWLSRGERYEPMIRSVFRSSGIPEDMYYLGLIESGYDPNAYSRAAAVGMWQFMTTTARGMGLRVDWWVDERRDPVKSTIAAAHFLGQLRDQFGSLYLAAAAYDGGPGRVARGLTRYADQIDAADSEERFFVLADHRALRSETSNYVPQLIAAALIGKNPSRFGIKLDSAPAYKYDSVRVPPATSMVAVAQASGATTGAIRYLNPFVLRGMTPPTDSLTVRIPAGTAAQFDSAFASLGDTGRVAVHRFVPKKATTLATVARNAGITATELRWYNPKLPRKSSRLTAGEAILVPEAEVVQVAFDVPDPDIERWGSGSRTSSSVHVVRRGETLSGIAAHYHTSVAALERLNHLERSVVYTGQTILVRANTRGKKTRTRSRSPKP